MKTRETAMNENLDLQISKIPTTFAISRLRLGGKFATTCSLCPPVIVLMFPTLAAQRKHEFVYIVLYKNGLNQIGLISCRK